MRPTAMRKLYQVAISLSSERSLSSGACSHANHQTGPTSGGRRPITWASTIVGLTESSSRAEQAVAVAGRLRSLSGWVHERGPQRGSDERVARVRLPATQARPSRARRHRSWMPLRPARVRRGARSRRGRARMWAERRRGRPHVDRDRCTARRFHSSRSRPLLLSPPAIAPRTVASIGPDASRHPATPPASSSCTQPAFSGRLRDESVLFDQQSGSGEFAPRQGGTRPEC